MKKLDEQIYLTNKNEKVSDISICQTGKNLLEVKSPKHGESFKNEIMK